MKSAEARLHAMGIFHTTAMRKQRLDIRIVRLRFERIPEEDEKIDLAIGDLGADLLIAAQGPALELGDLEAQLLFQDFAGRARLHRSCDEPTDRD